VRTILIILGAAILASAGGCRDKREYRASVAFHAKGTRDCLGFLRQMIGGEYQVGGDDVPDLSGANADGYAKQVAADRFDRALSSLPARIDKQQPDRAGERKAAAQEAIKIWRQLQPRILRMPADDAQARLDEIAALLDDVERD